MIIRTILVLSSVILLAGCGADAPANDVPATAAPPDSANSAPSAVRLSGPQLQQIHVEVVSATAPDDAIQATGVVEFNADRMARILPPVSGQVHDLAIKVGDTVAKDAVLFVLSSREVAAAVAEHLASHKDLELAEKTYAMTQDLVRAPGGVAHRAAAGRERAGQGQGAGRCRPRRCCRSSGFDGHPDERGRSPAGAHADPHADCRHRDRAQRHQRPVRRAGQPPLMTIADLSSVWVQADIFERDIHSIAAGQKANVTTAAYPDEHFIAQVAQIGTVVDAQTRTAKGAHPVVANPGRAPEARHVHRGDRRSCRQSDAALTVPAKAVFVEDGRSYAYVQARATARVRPARQSKPSPAAVRTAFASRGPRGRRPRRQRRRAAAARPRSRRLAADDPPHRLLRAPSAAVRS